MQIDGERIHRHDFGFLCADEFGEVSTHFGVVGHPRMLAVEVCLDSQLRPVVELVEQCLPCRARLQAERVAAQVHLFCIAVWWNQELIAESCERIGGVAGECVGFGSGEVVVTIHGRTRK